MYLALCFCLLTYGKIVRSDGDIFIDVGRNAKSCPRNYETITTQKECSRAAASLGYAEAVCCMPPGNWSDWPLGCFFKHSNSNLHMNSYEGTGNYDGSLLCKKSEEDALSLPSWLPATTLEDFECRVNAANGVVDWNAMRNSFRDLVQKGLDEDSLEPIQENERSIEERKKLQVKLFILAAHVLARFSDAMMQCPLGAVTASLFATCFAYLPPTEIAQNALGQPYEPILAELRQRTLEDLLLRDLSLLLDVAPLAVTAATEWNVFMMMHMFIGRLELPARMKPGPLAAAQCVGTSVAGYSSEHIQKRLLKYVSSASGKNIAGLKFLRGLDELVSVVLKDPNEFTSKYIRSCPPGAAAFAIAATMLSLMSNLSLFERFVSLAHHTLKAHLANILDGLHVWGIFHGLAKLGTFATRGYDLVWSTRELLVLPENSADFDKLRLNYQHRNERLAIAVQTHQHEPTRQIASFILSVARQHTSAHANNELFLYLTAVGGQPFTTHISAFIKRAVVVGLPALVIACMDRQAHAACEEVVAKDNIDTVLCVPKFEGHVIFVKYALIPVLLSAAVDTVWIDFDTFILQNPTESLQQARDAPNQILPFRSRMRYGSILFDSADHMCSITKICDARQHWPHEVVGAPDSSSDNGIEMLVTEHWDAKCLNNGLFYVRATHRTLQWFAMYISKLYDNPYSDNQNLFDAFLAHSTLDASAPETRPILRYALLDLKKKFACAEGHAGSIEELVTFHFWSADTRTREATPGEDSDGAGKIVARDGTQRVVKPAIASKSDLFDMFFGGNARMSDGVPLAAAKFIAQVKTATPTWKGMCAVSAVGIEDLLDETLLRDKQKLPDWHQVTTQHRAESHGPHGHQMALPEGLGEQPANCAGIPLQNWALALRLVANLEDASLLRPEEAILLKERFRKLDVGCLLTIQAYESFGFERLAAELRATLSER